MKSAHRKLRVIAWTVPSLAVFFLHACWLNTDSRYQHRVLYGTDNLYHDNAVRRVPGILGKQ